MTETDATNKPLHMPEKFLPYLDKYRIYKLFKDMIADLVINLPKDHLKHMKMFFGRNALSYKDTDRVILLVSPDLQFDVKRIVKEIMKDLGLFVITRRFILDRYEKHLDYVPGCVSPELMATVTKTLAWKEHVKQAGWLMFDHPCTVREARCLQQDGVLPTVTLVLSPPPPVAPPTVDNRTPARNFFQQDFEGLKLTYKASVKEVFIDPEDDELQISIKCFNAIQASAAGAQGAGVSSQAVGAPGVYRVLLLGPRGAGRRSQSLVLAKNLNLVFLHYHDLEREAIAGSDELAKRLKNFGTSTQIKAEIVRRRLLKKDCLDRGWVLTEYPASGVDFEQLDRMSTPPNRVIFLNASVEVCKARATSHAVDWCAERRPHGAKEPALLLRHSRESDGRHVEKELDVYFSETLAELRAAAGITAIEIDASGPFDQVQVKIQAAVVAAPAFDIEYCSQLKNVRAD